MGLEVATYISELRPLDPSGDDPKNQGDDHLRLIKRVLQNTFPTGNRPLRTNDWMTVSTNYNAVAGDDNKTILCNPSVAMIVTLPSPAPYAGWRVRVMRAASAPVVLVQPSAGTINGLARMRVSVPYEESMFTWTGSEYYRIKSAGEPPAGTILYNGSVGIPMGYAPAHGQALVQADCPELFAAWGLKYGGSGGNFNCPALHDRFIAGAGSIYGVGDTGGESVHTLTTAEVPAHSHAGTTDVDSPDHTHSYGTAAAKNGLVSVTGAFAWFGGDVGVATGGASTRHTHNYNTNSVGGGGAHENRPPYMAFYPIFKLC